MAPDNRDDDRERPSWREIDQRRERPQRREPARPHLPKVQADLLRQKLLRQAEALFQGKRAQPEYRAAVRALEASRGTKKFQPFAKKFLEEYGLPEDWATLNLLVDYPDPGVVVEALTAMAAQVKSRSYVEQQGFKGRLQILALTSKLAEVRGHAEDILQAL